MNRIFQITIAAILVLFTTWAAWPLIRYTEPEPDEISSLLTHKYLGRGLEPAIPLPTEIELDQRKVMLGKQLFNDPSISGNGFSCATCHPVERGGMDGLTVSRKTGSGFDVMNTPTVFNVGFNSLLLWNGQAQSLEEQLDGVINNPLHMDSNWPHVASQIIANPDYVEQFDQIYNKPPNQNNISNAIATFERSLNTPNSAFDRFLEGDSEALMETQKRGYRLFVEYGCISCHQGINLGGNLFSKFGVYNKPKKHKERDETFALGRYNYTGRESDRYVFRVPSLRNVEITAPYFHDGGAETLADAIRVMAVQQLNIDLSPQEIADMEDFLNSLTGEYQGKQL